MKKLLALVLAVVLLSPALAFAGPATDAALGLGAFAVFNQILGGVGVFGAAPAPVYAAPVPVYAAPVPVYAAPVPVYAAPAPVYVAPRPVYVAPPPVVVAPPVIVRERVIVRRHVHHWPHAYYVPGPVVYRGW